MPTARSHGPIAYLVNRYPKVSHSFIRREIAGLEANGNDVRRFAIRGWDDDPPDQLDKDEREATRYLLRDGYLALAAAVCREAATNTSRLCQALAYALRPSRQADRPLVIRLAYVAEAARLVGWLRDVGAIHLHAHFGTNAAEVAMLASNLGGPPYSFTVHGPEEFDRPEALDLSRKIGSASFVIAISSFGRSQLYRWASPDHWHKIHVVRCGVDHTFHAASAPCPLTPRLVCVGRICEQKGQLLLVEAAARLIGSGVALELVIVGDGEMRPEVERRIADLGIGGQVRITGWGDGKAVRHEILASRALVLPSFAEGLPVVLMEAMALGRPVVSTFVGGIPELVIPGESGWLVPAGDIESLTDAMRAVLVAPVTKLDAMGRAGRALIAERHDSNREAVRLAMLIRSCQ